MRLLQRASLYTLVYRYGRQGKDSNRHHAKRWRRAFQTILTIAGDAAEEQRHAEAIRILLEMVTLADACSIVYEHKAFDTFRSYDPKNVKMTFNGVELQGYADGSFIEFALPPTVLSGDELVVDYKVTVS